MRLDAELDLEHLDGLHLFYLSLLGMLVLHLHASGTSGGLGVYRAFIQMERALDGLYLAPRNILVVV